jgi:signal peptidase II
MKLTKGQLVTLFISLVVLADQALKIWVKLNMRIGESHEITSWFYIYFIENPGMAFGMEFISKLFLTLFRVVASGFLIYYLYKLICAGESTTGFLITIGAILAGAVGNLIDCLFYGVLFDSSYGQLASFLPEAGGYAKLFYGNVVDMFYFPLIETTFPSWLPIWGGEEFIFFRPIFNIADASISCGAIALLLFYRNNLKSI